ncbi:hypothetical protein FGO68_gene6443 [Halteria grandinella]|uniref:Uncharacterized protein n=1 Tax=Halteria grandinella TaxID=5974 RepID=A0A8J8N9H6_HALGN|nr:hypothetical protein FGO68_gene6443 [Halteria grandinella]
MGHQMRQVTNKQEQCKSCKSARTCKRGLASFNRQCSRHRDYNLEFQVRHTLKREMSQQQTLWASKAAQPSAQFKTATHTLAARSQQNAQTQAVPSTN